MTSVVSAASLTVTLALPVSMILSVCECNVWSMTECAYVCSERGTVWTSGVPFEQLLGSALPSEHEIETGSRGGCAHGEPVAETGNTELDMQR